MLPASMLLDLLIASGLCIVCYGSVSSKGHIYGTSFDDTRQHIFLNKLMQENQGHRGRLTVYVQTP